MSFSASLKRKELGLKFSDIVEESEGNSFSNTLLTPVYSTIEKSLYGFSSASRTYHAHDAAKAGNIAELERLFSFEDETLLRQDYNKKTPLHYAANFGMSNPICVMVP
jgi:ankyrin repeat protein